MTNKNISHAVKNNIYIIILAVVGLVLYFKATGFEFVWDDNPLYLNKINYPSDNAFKNINKFWVPNQMPMYAPVTYTIWSVISTISPENKDNLSDRSPFLFHLTNIIIHILNSIIIYLILFNLFRNKATSFGSSLIFLIHPLAVESAVWVSELRGLLSAFFGLLAILLFIKNKFDNESKKTLSIKTYIILIFLLVISFLSKPSGFVFPLILIIIDYFFFKGDFRDKLKRYIVLVSLTMIFILFSVNSEQGAEKVINTSFMTTVLLPFFSFIFYLFKFIVPINLSAVYGLTPEYLTSQSILYIYPCIFLGIIILKLMFRTKSLPIAAGLLIAFIASLPTSGIIPFYYQTFSTVADRYFYISLFGCAITISFLLSKIKTQNGLNSFIAVAGLILFFLSFNQISNWKTEFTHWNNIIRNSSIGIPQAFMGRGEANVKLGKQSEAIDDFSEAIKIDPKGPLYYFNRGNVYLDIRDYQKAINDYSKTLEINPKYIDAYINRGMAFSELPDKNKALSDFRKALSINPLQSDAINYIGVIYAQSGMYDSAYNYFKKACDINPSDIEASENLKNAETELNKKIK